MSTLLLQTISLSSSKFTPIYLYLLLSFLNLQSFIPICHSIQKERFNMFHTVCCKYQRDLMILKPKEQIHAFANVTFSSYLIS